MCSVIEQYQCSLQKFIVPFLPQNDLFADTKRNAIYYLTKSRKFVMIEQLQIGLSSRPSDTETSNTISAFMRFGFWLLHSDSSDGTAH